MAAAVVVLGAAHSSDWDYTVVVVAPWASARQ
jgi:hypothetical protein